MQQRETRTLVNNSFVALQRQNKQRTEKRYRVLNISRGGLCFQSSDEYELNEIVKLNLTIQQQSIHTAKGRVCYHSRSDTDTPENYGLSFLDKFIDTELIQYE